MEPGGKRSPEDRDGDQSSLEPAHKRCKVEYFPISDLPNEMLAAVLGHLPTGDKGKAAQVCNLWGELLDSPILWKETHIAIDMDKMTADCLFSIKKRQVRYLTITACLDVKKLQGFLHEMPRLVYLDLQNLKSLSHQTHYDLFPHEMLAMKGLLLPCLGTQSINVIARKMRNLVVLHSGQCECSPSDQGQVTFQALSSSPMQSLWMFFIPYISLEDHDLAHLKAGLPNVKSLYLSLSPEASETGMQMVAEMASLEELHLEGKSAPKDISIRPLCTGMAKIRHLQLRYVVSEANARSLAKMNYLEKLHLMEGNDVILECLAEELPKFKILTLVGFTEMTASGMTALAKMVQLEHLILGDCTVDDDGLQILSQGLAKMNMLELVSCKNFTDKGLEYVGDMRSLHTLGLIDCNIGDAGLLSLSEGTAPLACLILDQCSRVTEQGLQALMNSLHISIVEQHPDSTLSLQA